MKMLESLRSQCYLHDMAANMEMPNPRAELASVVRKLMMVKVSRSGGKLIINEYA